MRELADGLQDLEDDLEDDKGEEGDGGVQALGLSLGLLSPVLRGERPWYGGNGSDRDAARGI